MKKYTAPHSVNTNRVSGKEVNIIPAVAGAVGALVGVAAAGVALEGGKAVGRKLFGDDKYMKGIQNASNLRVVAE